MSSGFPPIWELIRYYNLFLLTGPVFLGLSAYFWVRYIGSKRKATSATSSRKRKRTLREAIWVDGLEVSNDLAGALACLLIGGVHLWGTYGSVLNAMRFRVDASQITEIRVERFRGDFRTDANRIGKPVTITARPSFPEGFKRLEAAKSFYANHEHFLDGCRIQFKLARSQDYSDQYLSLYTRTNRRSGLYVVIPHFGRGDPGALHHGGEYTCEDFHRWFSREILPALHQQNLSLVENGT